MNRITITNAYEGNLKNISLQIPKNKLVVFTGLSGSGKSTLLMDVLFNECQRQYLEAMSMQGIHKPNVDRIQGTSPAIIISQTDHNKNPRSTVGTISNIYTDLRMIYEKLGIRVCPHCNEHISAADCREEIEKVNNDFHVYMYCHKCGKRMNKITRTYFSFNTKEGACPQCEGLGQIHTIKKDKIIDETRSLEDGGVVYWEKQYAQYQTSIVYKAFEYYGIPVKPNTRIQDYTSLQKTILFDGIESPELKQSFPQQKPPQTSRTGKFEGVIPILWRRFIDKNGDSKHLASYFDILECPKCHGERLAELSRNIIVNHTRLPELSFYSLEELIQWIYQLRDTLSYKHMELVKPYLLDIETKINRFLKVGLGYLSLDRQVITLSGGELQRLRLAATLDSDLSGIIYILDEPTAGLHPKDTLGLIAMLEKLRDLGNSVLVIEHDIDVIKKADYIIDMGPQSGQYGGEIVAVGSIQDIQNQNKSITGQYLTIPTTLKTTYRQPKNYISIKNAHQFNLKNISLHIPTGCLVSVTGPSGSGKSTLIFEVLARKKANIKGLEQFDKIVEINQMPITRMRRSNIATFTDVYTEIRNVFAKTEDAKKEKLTSKHFSFNASGGRCENCEGLGYIENNMLFFANTKIVCPVCHGNQFQDRILAIQYKNKSIKDIMDLSIDEALLIFVDQPKIVKVLKLLNDVGLGYLQLGQSLTTLSGGEAQRLKLAKELIHNSSSQHNLYLMDEPSVGLHPQDIDHFLTLLNHLVDIGQSVIVVEHNQQIIKQSDWIIDLGPESGEKGGYIIFEGTPHDLKLSTQSITAKYL